MSDEAVADRALHPGTMLVRAAKELPSTALGLPAALAIIGDVDWLLIVPIALAAVGATILVNWLLWRRFRYGIGARGIVIESGLLNRTRRSIPFERIQDVDIERGPLHRLFGLAKVRVETGGSGSDEGLLDSVSLVEAERLRSAIRAGRAGEPQAVAEDVVQPREEARTIYAIGLRSLLLSGLFNFSFLYLAGLFAILQAFEAWLPFDIYDPTRWSGLVEARTGGALPAAAILILAVVALLLGVVTGVLRTVSRDFGFRLLAEPERFRRERGLLTRSEVVVAKSRVQLALRKTGPLRRALGWYELVFQTLSAGRGGAGHQSVAPFAREEEVVAILGETGGISQPDPAALTMVSTGFVWRKLIPHILLPLILTIVASLVWPPALACLALLPLFALKPFVERRFHRFALVGDMLFVQRGIWRQRLWMVPAAGAQAASVSRSWLQRRIGTATLLIDTAGASSLSDPRIVDLEADRARALAREILAYSGRKSGTER